MRIAQINTSYTDADSTGRNTKELHQYFKRNGIDSRVYAVRLDDTDDEDVYTFSGVLDQRVHGFLSRLSGLQGYFSHLSTHQLIRELSSYEPDVLLLGVLHSNCINFRMLFSYAAAHRIPVVFVLHDCYYMTGHCCHYLDVDCDRWRHGCGSCPSMKRWNSSWFFDTSERILRDKSCWYDSLDKKAVIAVSHWVEEDAIDSILSGALTTTIYNWIDRSIFYPRDGAPAEYEPFRGRQIALAVASGWSEEKGARELAEVARAMPRLELFIVGQPCEGLADGANIHLLGTIHDMDRLAALYAAADVFLNPSRMETFGKTTAEALCCGTPVVAYANTACRELVAKDRGALAADGDMEDYLARVRLVLENGKAHYRAGALAFADANFDPQINMAKYVAFMERLFSYNFD